MHAHNASRGASPARSSALPPTSQPMLNLLTRFFMTSSARSRAHGATNSHSASVACFSALSSVAFICSGGQGEESQ